VESSDIKEARRWFWREAFRNVSALLWGGVANSDSNDDNGPGLHLAIGVCAAAYGFLVTSSSNLRANPYPGPVDAQPGPWFRLD
jgi:hypothetical protein